MSEEERVNAMSANFWGQQEKVLANQKPVFRGGYRGGGAMGRGMGRGAPEQPAEQPDYSSTSPFSYEKTPHPNYICYRCGKKGGPDGKIILGVFIYIFISCLKVTSSTNAQLWEIQNMMDKNLKEQPGFQKCSLKLLKVQKVCLIVLILIKISIWSHLLERLLYLNLISKKA